MTAMPLDILIVAGPPSLQVISLPVPRTKRPYGSLRPTQKRERRKQLRSAISSDRIVPTPLHLFLGISNRIILDAFSELFSKELVEETREDENHPFSWQRRSR